MARATDAQIVKFELEHKAQFVNLVLANRLFLQLLKKIAGKPKTSKEYKAVEALGKNVAKNVGKWIYRQINIENKAGIPKVDRDITKYFLNPKTEAQLIDQAKKYMKPGEKENQIFGVLMGGMGFIPLIIWGVIALAAAYTATSIVDEINTTAEEKQDLLKQTESTLKDLNVTGAQAASIISSTQEQATTGSGLMGGFGSLIKWAGIGFVLYKIMEMQGKKKTATT